MLLRALSVKLGLKSSRVVLESEQIGKVTEECLGNLSFEGTFPHFTRACSPLARSNMLFSSRKDKRQKGGAERLNVMKTRCTTC